MSEVSIFNGVRKGIITRNETGNFVCDLSAAVNVGLVHVAKNCQLKNIKVSYYGEEFHNYTVRLNTLYLLEALGLFLKSGQDTLDITVLRYNHVHLVLCTRSHKYDHQPVFGKFDHIQCSVDGMFVQFRVPKKS